MMLGVMVEMSMCPNSIRSILSETGAAKVCDLSETRLQLVGDLLKTGSETWFQTLSPSCLRLVANLLKTFK